MSGFNFLEEAVKDYHRDLQNRGIAVVKKIPDPVNIIGTMSGGKVIGVRTMREWVDFAGWLRVPPWRGVAVFLEAKDILGASLSRSCFNKRPHQISLLEQSAQDGCVSGVVVRSKRLERCYFVPAYLLCEMPLRWATLDKIGSRLDGVQWFDKAEAFYGSE